MLGKERGRSAVSQKPKLTNSPSPFPYLRASRKQASSLITHWFGLKTSSASLFAPWRATFQAFTITNRNTPNRAKRTNWLVDCARGILGLIRELGLESELAQVQTISRLFHLALFVKFWYIFWCWIFQGLSQISGKEKESRSLVFTFSKKREIRHFHIVVVH